MIVGLVCGILIIVFIVVSLLSLIWVFFIVKEFVIFWDLGVVGVVGDGVDLVRWIGLVRCLGLLSS